VDLVTAGLVASVVEVGLRIGSLPAVARWVGVPLAMDAVTSSGSDHVSLPPEAVERVTAVRAVMRRWPFGDSCLRVALVAGSRLRSFRPRLAVGVRRVDGAVAAHAWLEIDGCPLDPASAAFAPLGRLDPL
jgi:hypothetical protein